MGKLCLKYASFLNFFWSKVLNLVKTKFNYKIFYIWGVDFPIFASLFYTVIYPIEAVSIAGYKKTGFYKFSKSHLSFYNLHFIYICYAGG